MHSDYFLPHFFPLCLLSIPNNTPLIPTSLFPRFMTSGFISWPTWYTQGCLCDHWVATIHWSLAGSAEGYDCSCPSAANNPAVGGRPWAFPPSILTTEEHISVQTQDGYAHSAAWSSWLQCLCLPRRWCAATLLPPSSSQCSAGLWRTLTTSIWWMKKVKKGWQFIQGHSDSLCHRWASDSSQLQITAITDIPKQPFR